MKKLLPLFVMLVVFSLFAPVLFAQDRDESPVKPDPSIELQAPDEAQILPYPHDDYYAEIERIKALTLQAYADEIADGVVKQLEQQKVWQDLLKEFLERARFAEGFLPEVQDITVPEKDEVTAFVFSTVESLGGMTAPEALVGIVADEAAAVLYTALVNLPFTEAQREVIYLPSVEYLTQEQIAQNVLHAIKNRTIAKYNAYEYYPFYYDLPYRMGGAEGTVELPATDANADMDAAGNHLENGRNVMTKPAGPFLPRAQKRQ